MAPPGHAVLLEEQIDRGTLRWQTDYLPVYAVWAAIVVIAFPPVFRYI